MEHAAAEHQEFWYNDPHIWVAVSFAIFIALFAKFVLPMILGGLDKRGAAIRNQLEQANRLRAEAEALLAQYERQQETLLKEAEAVLAQAKIDAETIRTQGEAELKTSIARRTQQAKETIARAEADAVAQVRTQLVDIATDTARQVIATQLKDQKDDPAIARAIKAIEQNIH